MSRARAPSPGAPRLSQLGASCTGCRRPQQARREAVQQAGGQEFSLRAMARNLGMAKNTVGKYLKAEGPPTKKLSAEERAKAETLAAS